MKLLRYGLAGQERPGILDAEGNVRDLSSVIADINGAALSDESLKKLLLWMLIHCLWLLTLYVLALV